MARMGYAHGMTTPQAQTSTEPEDRMIARGRTLGRLLDNERWSNRQAGMRLGLSHRYIGDRINGKVDITFSDVEAFAGLLKMPPAELFLKLLDHDSNVEPIGSQSALVLSLAAHTPKVKKPKIKRHSMGEVVALRAVGK